jgi:hypothetical protein
MKEPYSHAPLVFFYGIHLDQAFEIKNHNDGPWFGVAITILQALHSLSVS